MRSNGDLQLYVLEVLEGDKSRGAYQVATNSDRC